ncbi:MAG: DNA alkylation repair protein [Sphingobacteriales bacterium]|nr:DNA alkylation repair protein [Sphingobacteriales bacterium]MCC7224214.1 DNA alkylation repair protein [Chitinophagales bacterium]
MSLKDLYSTEFYTHFADILAPIVPHFDRNAFLERVFDQKWASRELKDRMRHTTQVLRYFLPDNFAQAANYIEQITHQLRTQTNKEQVFEYMFLPDYIEQYGIEHFDIAMPALEQITQLTSCEFAVRPFIVRYPEPMTAQMQVWSLHPNANVRRLSSEGSRPRLPWSFELTAFRHDPSPILPILNNLNDDPSDYVRRSVANSLNDISKDHPNIVVSIAQQWRGISIATDALLKHACRTLLKQGNPDILAYYVLNTTSDLTLTDFILDAQSVKMGDKLGFSLSISNQSPQIQAVRLEYALYFRKKNETLSRKVFKIAEKNLLPDEKMQLRRSHAFRPITTRVYYGGAHCIAPILNGIEQTSLPFDLLIP